MYVHTTTTFENPDSTTDFHWFKGSSNKHSHAYFELIVIMSGEFSHEYRHKKTKLTMGDAVLVTPNHYHLLTTKQPDAIHANFSITENAFRSLTNHSDEIYGKLKKNAGKPYRLSPEQLKYIETSINTVLSSPADLADTDFFIAALIHLILGYTLTRAPEEKNFDEFPEWLGAFLLKLSSPDVFCLPLNEIYKLAPYSQSRFINLFKQNLNVTPLKYITDLKMDYAKKLLTKTNYSVLDISVTLGFSSLSYFITLFKKYTNLTPSVYREKHYIPVIKPSL